MTEIYTPKLFAAQWPEVTKLTDWRNNGRTNSVWTTTNVPIWRHNSTCHYDWSRFCVWYMVVYIMCCCDRHICRLGCVCNMLFDVQLLPDKGTSIHIELLVVSVHLCYIVGSYSPGVINWVSNGSSILGAWLSLLCLCAKCPWVTWIW